MGISKGNKISIKKIKLYGHKRKIVGSVLNGQFLAKANRRKGFPLHLFAGKPPRSFLPPISSLPHTSSLGNRDTTSHVIKEPKTRDPLALSILRKPFKIVCGLLMELDPDKDHGLISETILHFSLRIYGLPECRREDLPLAVYFFVEDTFAIQSKIELCVELEEEGESSVIGVVFDTIEMKYDILRKDYLLEGAEVRLRDNTNLNWITQALCGN